VLASTALLATVLGGCAQSIEKSDSAGGKLQLITQGELGVCTFLPFKPFQFKEGGKIVGFDVDLIDLVAKDLKVKQSITDTPFEGIESGEALNSQKCDLAAAGMTITPERQQAMDFSKPYFNSTQALLTKNRSIDSLEKLRGKKVGVQQGTTGEVFAEKNKDRYGYDTVQFEDTGLQLTAVKTGQVDASVNDNGVVYAFAKDNPDTAVTHEFKTGEQYGYAVQKGNKALLAKINQVLDKAKQDGAYAKIFQKWFGKKPTNEPGLK
jgi:polar amino acid transport system substrate-binding protein